ARQFHNRASAPRQDRSAIAAQCTVAQILLAVQPITILPSCGSVSEPEGRRSTNVVAGEGGLAGETRDTTVRANRNVASSFRAVDEASVVLPWEAPWMPRTAAARGGHAPPADPLGPAAAHPDRSDDPLTMTKRHDIADPC
ncbi:MAG TPA: hypothetical protein VIK32_17810, partial [Candidatus Limnocylindrales bacterium]